MRFSIAILALLSLSATCASAASRHHQDWGSSMARLHAGDRLHITLKATGPLDATFLIATEQDFTADTGTVQRADVLKIERIRTKQGAGRGKHALIGTLVGAGSGAAIGAIAGHSANRTRSCVPYSFFCPSALWPLTPGEVTGGIAGLGALAGGVTGAMLPTHHAKTETIYALE